MISVYNIKPAFQQLLSPALKSMHNLGVTANQITWSSILLSLLIGILFWFGDVHAWMFLALPVGLFLRMALNAMDGMMARRYNQQSKKGELLNELGDIISDVFIFFPLLKFEVELYFLIVIFICLSIINEVAGLMGKVLGGQRRYDGPMGKSDRALILGIYGMICFFWSGMGGFSVWVFTIVILLLAISTFARISKSH